MFVWISSLSTEHKAFKTHFSFAKSFKSVLLQLTLLIYLIISAGGPGSENSSRIVGFTQNIESYGSTSQAWLNVFNVDNWGKSTRFPIRINRIIIHTSSICEFFLKLIFGKMLVAQRGIFSKSVAIHIISKKCCIGHRSSTTIQSL